MKRAIMMNPGDNVATALDILEAGDKVTVQSASQETPRVISATANIPFGHKMALAEIDKGAEVIKYGELIGLASKAIGLGDYVHVHNVISARFASANKKEA